MVNRPKQIGTAGETACVKAAHTRGFPHAERRALHGTQDLGDILLAPGIILEVKSGQAAKTASQKQVDQWLTETETERRNAGAAFGFLVTQRVGYGIERAQHWWAHTTLEILAALAVDATSSDGLVVAAHHIAGPHMMVQLELRNLLTLLREAGWGEPLETETENQK